MNGAKYVECSMFNISYTEILSQSVLSGQWSETDQLPVADPNWPTISCIHGYEYDTAQYDATLVTEVRIIFECTAVYF